MRPTNLTLDALSREIAALQRQVRDLQAGTVPPGTVDHGGLTGLADDDHTQYHNDTRGDARYAPVAKGVTNGDSHDHSGGDGAQIDHGGLAGLTDADHPASAITVTTTGFGGALSSADDTVQKALATLDDHTHAAASVSIPGICNGRLTLESGVPVSTSDQADKTSVIWTPCNGNQIAIYNGSTWDVLAFTEASFSISAWTASKLHDIFGYNNSGALGFVQIDWTNATTRGTTLTRQDGVLVISGNTGYRYLGTIYVNSAGKVSDTVTKQHVWNYYNRVPRRLYVTEATSHKYNGAARLWNNSETNNRLEFVVGVAEDAQTYTILARLIGGADGSYAIASPYLDGSEVSAAYRCTNLNNQAIVAGMAAVDFPAAGFHYLNTYELGNHADSTMVRMALGAQVRG